MKRDDFEQLKAVPKKAAVLSAANLNDQTPRTLVIGETADCYTFHVYLGQDGHIHVVVYAQLPAEQDGPRFLVLHHKGPGGEKIVSDEDYVHAMPAWPESCDLEFCKALAQADTYPLFAAFDADADERRRARHDGFAGFTANYAGAIRAELLSQRLRKEDAYPQSGSMYYYPLAAQVILQAANELGVPVAIEGDSDAYVAEAGSDAVYSLACRHLQALPQKSTRVIDCDCDCS